MQENVSNTSGDELLIKLSFPEEIGPIGDEDLSQFLYAAQKVS